MAMAVAVGQQPGQRSLAAIALGAAIVILTTLLLAAGGPCERAQQRIHV